MAKTVGFGTTPRAAGPTPNPKQADPADAFVRGSTPDSEPMKRLTIDLPLSLHAAIKVQCAQAGRTMAEEIRTILQERFSV